MGWDHCGVLSGRLLFLSLCSSGFQDLLRLKPPSLLMLLGCIHLPLKMEPILSSETSASNTQTPGSYPKESLLHLQHGENLNLKSRISYLVTTIFHVMYPVRTMSYSYSTGDAGCTLHVL
jgi:hypothetical protein